MALGSKWARLKVGMIMEKNGGIFLKHIDF